MNEYKFRVLFLEDAKEFLGNLNEKTREKVIYNIWKSRTVNDKELLKKLKGEIWEFRTKYNKMYIRLFAFWDKTDKTDTLVVSTHGIIKKTMKTPSKEIKKAIQIKEKYFNLKNKEQ